MDIHQIHHETTQRPPQDRELFVHDGHVHVYRQGSNSWEDLGETQESGLVPEVGNLQFELQQGIVAEGSPAFILRLLLRAFLGVRESTSADFADTCFNIFRECGWRGPIESDNKKVSGSLTVRYVGESHTYKVDDLRIIMAQLQDPNHNGWLQFEEGDTISFISVGRATKIDIRRTSGGETAAGESALAEDEEDPRGSASD